MAAIPRTPPSPGAWLVAAVRLVGLSLLACRTDGAPARPEARPATALTGLSVHPDGVCTLVGGELRCRGDRAPVPTSGVQFVALFQGCAVDDAGLVHCPSRAPRPLPPDVDPTAQAGSGAACLRDRAGRVFCDDPGRDPWVRPVTTEGAVAASGSLVEGCLLDRAGALACWQTEPGSPTSTTPMLEPLGRRAEFTALAAESTPGRGCATARTGEVRCWRRTADGTTVEQPEVHRLGAALELSVADTHACARLDDGQVACWGENCWGELGVGDRVVRPRAVVVPGLVDAVAVATTSAASCARTRDGALWCWGRRSAWGDLPGGAAPTVVQGLRGVTALAVGEHHGCAAASDGGVNCWGRGFHVGTADGWCDRYTPVRVSGVAHAVDVAVDLSLRCARTSEGRAYCWEDPRVRGEDVRATREIPGTTLDVAVAGELACAIDGSGRVRCWSFPPGAPTLVAEIPLPDPAVQIEACWVAGCAVTTKGEAHCWAIDGSFRRPEHRGVPTRLPVQDVVDVAVESTRGGNWRACWRTRSGRVGCADDGLPVELAALASISDARALAVRAGVVCVVRGDGKVACEGPLDERLGVVRPRIDDATSPAIGGAEIRLEIPSAAIGLGRDHACALGRDGSVRCWGRRDAWFGQRGDGVEPFARAPVRVD